jgi:ankyrin repeat protein
MLLKAGADPTGTNALLRALDFNDHEAGEMLRAHGAQADEINDAEIGGESPWVVPALHQAARRRCDARMVALLLRAGADPTRHYKGTSAYAFARVHGTRAVSEAIEEAHGAGALTADEQLLANAADGLDQPGQYIDPAKLPEAYATLLHEMVGQDGRLDHVRRLVELGLPWDAPDSQGLPPVQLAGWEGRPEMLRYFIRLGPDLSHINSYGGTLLGTILHGSENCPARDTRDHLACLEIALHEGVALPRSDIGLIGREDIRAFLEDWAEARPGQVI